MREVTLDEALSLVCLYAEVEPAKFERAAVRWLARYLSERCASLFDANLAAAALAALPSGGEQARELLRGMVAF